MIRLAIFASGGGSNALSIIRHFEKVKDIAVVYVLSNNPNPGVFRHAESFGIEYRCFGPEERDNPELLGEALQSRQIDYIVLAGYMKKIPGFLLEAYPDRILNIHPALLPSFGGKGMYGMNVHRAVIEAGAKQSGISIHLVNEEYDRGAILFQQSLEVHPQDTAESLAKRVLELEHRYYPQIIEEYIRKH